LPSCLTCPGAQAVLDLAESERQVDLLAAELEEARQQLEQLERIDHIGVGLAPVPGAAALQILAQAFAQPADSHAAAAAQYAALLATRRDLQRAREVAAQQEAACAAAEQQLAAAVGCLRQAIEEIKSAGKAGEQVNRQPKQHAWRGHEGCPTTCALH